MKARRPNPPLSGSLRWLAAAMMLAVVAAWAPAGASTLADVRARGHLLCGVVEGAPGFSTVDQSGTWSGFDVDFCAAVATVVLGRKDAVKYRALNPSARYQALANKDVDLLARTPSWSLARDTELGLALAATLFIDGQGFLVRRGFAVASALELSGASVCAMTGTNAETAVADYFRARHMRYQLVLAERWQDVVKAYADGGCTLVTGDITQLAIERSRLTAPADHMLLPELVVKEPSGPVVRRDDDQWREIVHWIGQALVAAEELGISKDTVDVLHETSRELSVRRFLGVERNVGDGLGLDRDWTFRLIRQSGNYGEIYERNLGPKTPLALDRGINNLWSKGGVMYAVPVR